MIHIVFSKLMPLLWILLVWVSALFWEQSLAQLGHYLQLLYVHSP